MFPPTIMAAPTSDIALPKPMRNAERMANLASTRTTAEAWTGPAPSALTVSEASSATPLSAEMTRPSTTGEISTTSAITIALGVKRSCSPPNGPVLERNRKTTRPAKTVGME